LFKRTPFGAIHILPRCAGAHAAWWTAEADAQADLRGASATADCEWVVAILSANKIRVTAENSVQKAFRSVPSNSYHASETTDARETPGAEQCHSWVAQNESGERVVLRSLVDVSLASLARYHSSFNMALCIEHSHVT
jgi:hypothetical protein